MNAPSSRLTIRPPLWLKILGAILGLSVLLPLLQPLQAAPNLLGLVIVLGLMAFPGKVPGQPRLLRFLPWFWLLEILSSITVLGSRVFIPEARLPPEFLSLSWIDLITSAAGVPLLLYLYLKKHPLFLWIAAFTTAVQALESLRRGWWADELPRGVPAWVSRMDLVTGSLVSVLILLYLIRWWPRWVESSSEEQ